MHYATIAIGDELLLGQVTDTNSGAIARMLDPYGWSNVWAQVIHDDAGDIRRAVDRAFEAADVVLVTGGLGPTKDDITKNTLAEYYGGGMIFDDATLANVIEVTRSNGRALNDLTRDQARVPRACRVIQNRVGTAPIMWFETLKPDGSPRVLVSMPGVPHETLTMMREEVIPQLLERFKSDIHIGHRVAIITDLAESTVAMKLAEWEQALPSHLHLAYLPKARLIRLRLDGAHKDADTLNADLDREFAAMLTLLDGHVAATADISLAEAVIQKARRSGLTICSAESCTGGNIAHQITLVAGCSDVMLGSVVSYSNSVKTALLGVKPQTLAEHGAVSTEVVEQMLQGALTGTGADVAVATSGIAGPGGGTPQKPVGTVVIGALRRDCAPVVETLHFRGDRQRVIDGATNHAFTLMLKVM